MSAEWLTGIAALLAAVSWPIAIVTVILVLRPQLLALLSRVEGLNVAGTSVQFQKEAKENIEDAAETLAESSESTSVNAKLDGTMLELISRDPRESIRFAWDGVREALLELANRHKIVLDLRSVRKSAQQLSEVGIISTQLANTIMRLHSTFKAAIRVDNFALEDDTVKKYVELTLETKLALRNLVRQ